MAQETGIMVDALKIAAKAFEALTSPDKEDWTVIVDGEDVCVTAMQEQTLPNGECKVWVTGGMGKVADLKKLVESLPPNSRLGMVSFAFPTDYEETGAMDVFLWLREQARAKDFSLVTLHGSIDTKKAIEAILTHSKQM
jgi:hypothetical protein